MLSWFLLDSMYCDAGKVLLKFATKLGNETKCFNWCSRPVAEIIQIEWNREEEDWGERTGNGLRYLGDELAPPPPHAKHCTVHIELIMPNIAQTLHRYCTNPAHSAHLTYHAKHCTQCTLDLSCQTLHSAHCSLHSSPTKFHSEVFSPLCTICTIPVTVSTMVTACNVWLCKVARIASSFLSSCLVLLNT